MNLIRKPRFGCLALAVAMPATAAASTFGLAGAWSVSPLLALILLFLLSGLYFSLCHHA